MNKKLEEKIFNLYQADFLIKNGCTVISTGREGKNVYVGFLINESFDTYMERWRIRKH